MALCKFKLEQYEDDDGNLVWKHYDDIGSRGDQVAVSYEIALDPEFKQIIDCTYYNTNPEYFKEWHSPLPVIGKDGEFYHDLEKVYARGRVICGVDVNAINPPENATDEEICRMIDATDGLLYYSQWAEVGCDTQRYQKVVYTSGNEIIEETDTDEIKFNFD